MKSAIVIPARLQSTRLPRKLLLSETGKTLIEHTWQTASGSQLASEIIVATDSREIFETVNAFGGQAVMTSESHRSGSDRVVEAATALDADIIVNLQADEPELDGAFLDRLIERLTNDETAEVATLATPIRSLSQFNNPACVKVVLDHRGRAMYFSRSPIPAVSDSAKMNRYFGSDSDSESADNQGLFLQHIGVYGFRRKNLLSLPKLNPAPLEKLESLEQLRFLANGWVIGVEIVEHSGTGIDTAEDYAAFVNRVGNG